MAANRTGQYMYLATTKPKAMRSRLLRINKRKLTAVRGPIRITGSTTVDSSNWRLDMLTHTVEKTVPDTP